MKKFALVVAATFLWMAITAFGVEKSHDEEICAVTTALKEVQKTSGKLLLSGRLDESISIMVARFPKETRTGIEAFMLGNALFEIDQKISYAMHKEAFEKLPSYPNAALEWAMEQHRVGEHTGALAAYDTYTKTNPNFAPVHGLAADCLIRLGKIPEACARWKKSEEATRGTIATLESLVCDIYKNSSFHRQRAELRSKAEMGDAEAAAKLVLLDGTYEHDWWNAAPHMPYLESDIPLLEKLPEGTARKALECASKLFLQRGSKTEEQEAEKDKVSKERVETLLKKYGFFFDSQQTLPPDGGTLSLMLGAAMDANLLKIEDARKLFGPALLKRAATSHDAELHNVLANIFAKTPEMESVEKKGWEATGDARFAAGYLIELMSNGKLKKESPELLAALKQFPENSVITRIVMGLTPEPDQELLVRAIKSEFRKFSPSALYAGTDVNLRPRATALRRYFALLTKLQK